MRAIAALRRRRNFFGFIAEVEALHAVAELVALHVEKARGLALVPTRLLGGLEDQRALEVPHQVLEVDALFGQRRRENRVDATADAPLVGPLARKREHLALQHGSRF